MAAFKLTGLAAAVGLFFHLFVFGPFYEDGRVQAALLVITWTAVAARFSLREALSAMRFCLPFVATLGAFGVLFHVTAFLGRTDWLRDSLLKAAVFPSSLFFLKTVLSFVTYLDLLRLPVPMSRRVDLITFKAALQKGGAVLARLSWYAGTYPDAPEGGSRTRRVFKKYACVILSLFVYLYEDIERSRQTLENRSRFLRRKTG